MNTINCKGSLVDLSTPKVMGVINCTPDSFYDGGKLNSETQLLKLAETMIEEGATFLDVGGYSSRPNAANISIDEELNRVLPAISLILKHFPEIIISIDTFRSEVAQKAVEAGAALVNDISAGTLDPLMFDSIAKLKVPYIIMHMRGNPTTMQEQTHYDNINKELLFYFSEKLESLKLKGINDVIVDPGFGFAKTREQNFELLNHLELFNFLEKPLMVGLSRKSMIYQTLNNTPEEALNGTTSLNTIALLKHAKILRVHDVKPAMECIKLVSQLNPL